MMPNDTELGDIDPIVFVPEKPTPAQKKELNKQRERTEKAVDDYELAQNDAE